MAIKFTILSNLSDSIVLLTSLVPSTLPIVKSTAASDHSPSPNPINLVYHNGSFIPLSTAETLVLKDFHGNLASSSYTIDSIDIPLFTYHLCDGFPSAHNVHDLHSALINLQLPAPIGAYLDLGSPLHALHHAYLQVSCLHSTATLTTNPDHLWETIQNIHNTILADITTTLFQLGMGDILLEYFHIGT